MHLENLLALKRVVFFSPPELLMCYRRIYFCAILLDKTLVAFEAAGFFGLAGSLFLLINIVKIKNNQMM